MPGSAVNTWLQTVQAANPQWIQAVALPANSVAKVPPRDTLDALAQRLFLDASTAGFATLVGAADILTPLAQIPVLAARMATQKTADPRPDWTLLATAQSVGLATISGQVSRFMLNGLRLPMPEQVDGVWRATGPMAGLYDLVGQQLTGPAPSGVASDTLVFSVTMTKGRTPTGCNSRRRPRRPATRSSPTRLRVARSRRTSIPRCGRVLIRPAVRCLRA